MKTIDLNSLLTEANLSADILEEDGSFIAASRAGISGAIIKPTIKILGVRDLGVRDLFISLLNTCKNFIFAVIFHIYQR